MARDYAPHNRSSGRKKGGLPAWVWLFSGLALGAGIASFVYIARPAAPMKLIPGMPDPQAEAPPPAGPAPAQEPAADKRRFTFYELLPSQEVVIPAEPAPPAGKPAQKSPAASGARYVIQVASYRKPTDAESHKAQLALLGIESRVEKVTIDNRDTYYRVRVGPERDLARAQALVAELKANGMDGLLVKID